MKVDMRLKQWNQTKKCYIEEEALEEFGPSSFSWLEWRFNQLRYREVVFLISVSFITINNTIGYIQEKALLGFEPSSSSLLDWRSDKVSCRAVVSDICILFTYFHHTTCEITCDTVSSSAANQGDNTISVAQGGTATPDATKQLLPPDRVF